MGPESRLEAACVRYAARAGWRSVKLQNAPGWPDRLFLGPYRGEAFFAEFKSPTGQLTKLQQSIHRVLARSGHAVYVIRTTVEFKELLT